MLLKTALLQAGVTVLDQQLQTELPIKIRRHGASFSFLHVAILSYE
jgi:hypothetical protein